MGPILLSAVLTLGCLKSVRETGLREWSDLVSGKGCRVVHVSACKSYIPAHTFVIRGGEMCHSSFHEMLVFQNIILLCFKMKCPAKQKDGRRPFIHVFLETSKCDSKWYNLNLPGYWCYRSTTVLQRTSGTRPSEQGTGRMSGKLDVVICPSSSLSSLSCCFLRKLIYFVG